MWPHQDRIAPGTVIDADTVAAMIADENDRDDPWEGHVLAHVRRFRSYRCDYVPIARIDLAGHGYDPLLAAEYAGTPADRFPPVVYDPVSRTLIEGYHRTHAAVLRTEDVILALVGIEATADPDWTHP